MKRISSLLMIYSLNTMAAETIPVIPIGKDEKPNPDIVTEEQFVTIPKLEGGVTAVIGSFYVLPSADNIDYSYSRPESEHDYTVINADPGYHFGFDAALGYIFENSSQSIELAFRDLNTSDNNSEDDVTQAQYIYDVTSNLDYHLRALDLTLGQFVDIGQQVQTRLVAGLSYVELKREQTSASQEIDASSNPVAFNVDEDSAYKGLGPRLGIDVRYDFGQGIGIVASGSFAYFLGKFDNDYTLVSGPEDDQTTTTITDHVDNQGVMNFRGNIGVDYVFFFDNEQRSTTGIEIGYLIDYYDDAIANVDALNILSPGAPALADYDSTVALSFSGPYVNLKGVF